MTDNATMLARFNEVSAKREDALRRMAEHEANANDLETKAREERQKRFAAKKEAEDLQKSLEQQSVVIRVRTAEQEAQEAKTAAQRDREEAAGLLSQVREELERAKAATAAAKPLEVTQANG